MFGTDSYFCDGTKTFRLTFKPSSVLSQSLDVVTRGFKIFKTLRVLYARDYKEWFLCVKMLFKISVTGECARITDFLFIIFTNRYAEKISKLEHKVTKN